ncbi:hypothetical protein LX32DRAFT_294147 [Colletotrichum zoysiae]|uniref:Uncharacterized protein n=1 Tax=Colletotrichum zoysiae TaxID=1216348 RepID=A0AAD9HL51_9PEZI|nr:hypothetical protein LX32DRAFT_294147 [Colletotrichum zoysiae]
MITNPNGTASPPFPQDGHGNHKACKSKPQFFLFILLLEYPLSPNMPRPGFRGSRPHTQSHDDRNTQSTNHPLVLSPVRLYNHHLVQPSASRRPARVIVDRKSGGLRAICKRPSRGQRVRGQQRGKDKDVPAPVTDRPLVVTPDPSWACTSRPLHPPLFSRWAGAEVVATVP